MIAWDNALLQPVLITFNRAEHLKATLTAFQQAGLTDMCLHVLDNSSTDETHEVVQQMRQLWPKLTYHRNTFNIGGNANILRALELTDSAYHWVIGDDDHWSITADLIAELHTVMQKKAANVIRLGWLVSDKSRSQTLSGDDLVEDENLFYASLSMISATISLRSIWVRFLARAYQNVGDSYPQLVPMMCANNESALKVYTLSQNLIIHTPSTTPGYFSGDLEWYAGWYRTSRFLETVVAQKKFNNEITYYMCRHKPGYFRQFFRLVKVLAYYKSFKLSQTAYLFSMFAYGRGWRGRISLLIIMNAILPSCLLSMLRRSYFTLRRIPAKTVITNRERL